VVAAKEASTEAVISRVTIALEDCCAGLAQLTGILSRLLVFHTVQGIFSILQVSRRNFDTVELV
jgi:hypothetical protein